MGRAVPLRAGTLRAGTLRAASLLGIAVALGACGDEVPRGGVSRTPQPLVDRRLEPADLLPADLDLVVRVDLARLRSGLGPTAMHALAGRLPGDRLLRDAMVRADAITVGLRADDLEAGDRVVVVEGALAPGALEPDPATFAPGPTWVEKVRVWDRAGDGPAPREQVARVMRLEDRAIVFVTALEVDATSRVLRAGPDERRGQPFAEGIVSLDWRPRPLRTSLAKRFPSIAGVLRGLSRVRATVAMGESSVEVRAEIEAADEASAVKVARFLELLRDNAGDDEVLRAVTIERAGSTVHVASDVPAEVVLRAVAEPSVAEPAGAD